MELFSGGKSPTVIFCDGACSGNPGPGGWGTVVVKPAGSGMHVRELGGSAAETTNNQMELLAAIRGLEYVAELPGDILLYTDSVYVIRGITQWIWGWRQRGWKTAEGAPVANQDYWQKLSGVVGRRERTSKIHWSFVKGHSGIPGNERCDEIAVAHSKGLRPALYDGPLTGYGIAILDVPENTNLPEPKPKQEKKAAAHSYLSVVDGVPRRHATWSECEARVKGRSGAKFKKAMTEAEEAVILKGWGYGLGDL